ncbi:MAG: hypothetical protein R2714_01530 [Microthrixaceae bacterium]
MGERGRRASARRRGAVWHGDDLHHFGSGGDHDDDDSGRIHHDHLGSGHHHHDEHHLDHIHDHPGADGSVLVATGEQ